MVTNKIISYLKSSLRSKFI